MWVRSPRLDQKPYEIPVLLHLESQLRVSLRVLLQVMMTFCVSWWTVPKYL